VLRGRRGAEDERKHRRLAEGGRRSGRRKWKQKGFFPLQEKDKKQQKIHILFNIGIST